MAVPKVHKKIYLMLDFLQRKLGTNYEIDIRAFSMEEKKEHPNANFLVGPTGRGNEDIDAFGIRVHRRCGAMKDFELFSSVLHELLHAMYWPVATAHSSALKEVRSKAMKSHLEGEMYDSREQGTYRLERAIAPILWPEFLLDMEQKSSKLLPDPTNGAERVEQNGTHEDGKKTGSRAGEEEGHSERSAGTLQDSVQGSQ